MAILLPLGRAGPFGARPVDLVFEARLTTPTVHRMLAALVRAGLVDRDEVDRDETTRRYHLGPEVSCGARSPG